MIDAHHLDGRRLTCIADAAECAALARRFGLVRIDSLQAEVDLIRQGRKVAAEGRLTAAIVQSCAISGEDLPVAIAAPLKLRFVPPASRAPDEEIELNAEDCDEIEMDGDRFDLGEAIAQSLALEIDPFACGPEAEAARVAAGLLGEEQAGPFAALAKLKK
jgi:uncharacterized metal-binding protein YceD (DUF177 family)